MSLQAKENRKNSMNTSPLGLYVHVPFCPSTCDFCAFYQEQPERKQIQSFLDTLKEELYKTDIQSPVSTVFWGGGTPGLLLPRDMEYLGEGLLSVMSEPPVEWTVEMAPSTVTLERLETLKALGVTRISMGVQSFNEDLLKAMGRHQAVSRTFQAWEWIQQVGFASTNIDMIFAVPGQTFEQWEADLGQAVALNPDHISTYCLTFEEDTALYVRLLQGKIKRSVEQEAQFYLQTWDTLEQKGYAQYEISNFSKLSHACLHNINTWKMYDWVGIGPSAASQYQGWRYQNDASLELWQTGVSATPIKRQQREPLTDTLKIVDALVFGLRMNEGVRYDTFMNEFPSLPWERFKDCLVTLVDGGWVHDNEGQLQLTLQGRLIADTIGCEIMTALEDA